MDWLVHDGYDDQDKDEQNTTNDGPANEQPQVAYSYVGTDVFATMVYMNSNTNGTGNYQCWCASFKMSPGAEPELVAREQLTNYSSGERQCNHPTITTTYLAGKAYSVWGYGSDYNNANPQTFMDVLDPTTCGDMYDGKLKISNNNNNNEGAPKFYSTGGARFKDYAMNEAVIYGLYGSTNNNDATYARNVSLTMDNGALMLANGNLTQTIAPANIPRPWAGLDDAGMYALHCQARGNNRPPEMGAQCAYQNTQTGEIMWKEYVRQSSVGAYANQVTVQSLDASQSIYAIQLLVSSGNGNKDQDVKGSTIPHTYVVRATADGLQQVAHIEGIGAYASHQGMCAGAYGDKGKFGIAIVDAPITGIGLTLLDVAVYDQNAQFLGFDKGLDRWVVSPYDGDSGYYQNKYGGNPHTQGRGYPTCAGPVPNPSHGMDVGFMPHVKSFWMVPHVAGVALEEKLSLFFALVPAEVDAQVPPGSPTEGEEPTEYGSGVETEPTPPTNPPGTPGGPGLENAETAGGCSVANRGFTTSDLNGFGLVALGLGFLGLALRRREEV